MKQAELQRRLVEAARKAGGRVNAQEVFGRSLNEAERREVRRALASLRSAGIVHQPRGAAWRLVERTPTAEHSR